MIPVVVALTYRSKEHYLTELFIFAMKIKSPWIKTVILEVVLVDKYNQE